MKVQPAIPGVNGLLYGGDYNPEQWLHAPDILREDLRLMKLAHINAVTVGVFAWASLEPQQDHFTFDWLDRVLDGLEKNGQKVILATPSGAKPNWLALKYPEVRRCTADGTREPQQGRHNHCMTSPVYRSRVALINTKLAERYAKHPALILWHISNEFGGYCYCPLCMAAFRRWLEARYHTVENMNQAFWSKFWSHAFGSFDEVTVIDKSIHGLELDWKRFMTEQVMSFIEVEKAPLKKFTPHLPVTTNFMGLYDAYDYPQMAQTLDVVSWDAYPHWHDGTPEWRTGCQTAFTHDLYRCMKPDRAWLLMESTPSNTNWAPISRPKRPGVLRLSGLQAIAHGADSVLYFQFRKSRGSYEKFHGAVVDHVGHEYTRVFQETAALGAELARLKSVVGGGTTSQVALLYDWPNAWAIAQAAGPRNMGKDYAATCLAHYEPFWLSGIAVDVIESTRDFSGYKLVVAPMLYMLRPGVAARLQAFVAAGGTLVVTYMSGIADENDLCFLGGWPGPLKELLGIWVQEQDVLHQHQKHTVVPVAGNPLALPAVSQARHYCDVVQLQGAEALALYGADFYAGQPAVTRRRTGKGTAYYVASRNDDAFTLALCNYLMKDLALPKAIPGELPLGVTAQRRSTGDGEVIFVMNFNEGAVEVPLATAQYRDVLTNRMVQGTLPLAGFDAAVLQAV